MNILEQKNIRAPSGDEEECAKFTIDDIEAPFIMHGVAEIDERYTLSFYVKSSISASITIAGTVYPTSSEWTRYVINFTADEADLPIYFDSPGTYYLYNTQLEVGDKDTDFSLSPDDYSTTAQMEAYIAVTSQNILSSVSQTYATKSEYGDLSDEFLSFKQTWKQEATELIGSDYIINTVGNYYALNDDLVSAENRITTAESVIAQHTADISLTVKEQDVTGDYLIGKINLDSTTAQIEAKNINLTASDVVNIINSGTTTIEAKNINLTASDVVNIINSGTTTIEASKIDLSGYVTVSALGTAGATTIDGANITTGTISADRIDADGLFSKTVTATNLTVTGNSMLGGWNVTATRIKSSSSIYMGAAEAGFMIMNEANNCYLYAQNSSGTSTFQVTRNGYLVATGASITGDITATGGKIGGFTITSSSIYTEYDGILSSPSGSNIYIGTSNIGFGASYLSSYGSVELNAYDGTGSAIEGGAIKTYNTSGETVFEVVAPYGSVITKGGVVSYDKYTSYGDTGWYNGTYDGGWYMIDTTWIRAYNNKGVYTGGNIMAGGELRSTAATGLRIAYGNYGFLVRNDGSSTYFLLTNSGDAYGNWTTSFYPMQINNSTGAITMNSRFVVPPDGAAANRPKDDNTYACGHTSYRYTYVYAASGVSTTSDEREKDILDLDLSEMSDYFMSLKPIAFRWNYGDDRKIRFGLGAQTSERKLYEAGYDPSQFAMIQHDELEVPSAAGLTDRYGLNYQEIQMLTMVQTQINTRELVEFTAWKNTTDTELAIIVQKQDEFTIKQNEQQILIEQLLDENAALKKRVAQLEEQNAAA